jgi:hypothetical protein
MPDLGYSGGMSDGELEASIAPDAPRRDLMVISLRDDTEVAPRPYPDADWISGIRRAADALGLTLCVVTQVSVDDPRSVRLAEDLGGAMLVGWPELDGHGLQEERLRAIYRRTAVAASDRLHVIIAALTEGAAPVGLQLDDSDKISRHFSTIGIEDIAVNSTGLSADALADRIVAIGARREECVRSLLTARDRLDAVRGELQRRLGVAVRRPETVDA